MRKPRRIRGKVLLQKLQAMTAEELECFVEVSDCPGMTAGYLVSVDKIGPEISLTFFETTFCGEEVGA